MIGTSALIRPGRALITITRLGHEDGLLDVVRDEQHGLAIGFPEREQQFLHQRSRLVVERAEGLVEEQDLRLVGERACDRRALLHAAGQHLRKVVLEPRQADLVEPVPGEFVLPSRRQSAFTQSESRRSRES